MPGKPIYSASVFAVLRSTIIFIFSQTRMSHCNRNGYSIWLVIKLSVYLERERARAAAEAKEKDGTKKDEIEA